MMTVVCWLNPKLQTSGSGKERKQITCHVYRPQSAVRLREKFLRSVSTALRRYQRHPTALDSQLLSRARHQPSQQRTDNSTHHDDAEEPNNQIHDDPPIQWVAVLIEPRIGALLSPSCRARFWGTSFKRLGAESTVFWIKGYVVKAGLF